MTDPVRLPESIRKRDGRVVPFEADKISQALFAATEALGKPNVFLARELTEGVLHFLSQEAVDTTPTTVQIAELTAKVVRELGQPALAAAFEKRQQKPVGVAQVTIDLPAGRGPDDFLGECARSYSLGAMYTRDLVAAQEAGWLTLLELEHPNKLLGCVAAWQGPGVGDLLANLVEAGRKASATIAVEGLDWADPDAFEQHLSELRRAAALVPGRIIIHLNSAEGPAWMQPTGPLFPPVASREQVREQARRWLDHLLAEPIANVRVDWRLSEADIRDPFYPKFAAQPSMVRFVFDRPRRPRPLGEGLDRQHPATLLGLGVHFAPLFDLPGVAGNMEALFAKLPSLARLAVSAGLQKRRFLRQHHPGLERGFLLDRARLVVIPVGLETLTTRWFGQGIAHAKGHLEFVLDLLRAFQDSLRKSAGQVNLEAVMDSPWWSASRAASASSLLRSPHLEGLVAGAPNLDPRELMRLAGAIQDVAQAGTLVLPADSVIDAPLLEHAWRRTGIARLSVRQRLS